MDEYVARLVSHRERFQSWGLVISFLALVAAIWTRAPELEVEIPLFAGTRASINAGYVVSLAPTFIAFSLCWAVGALVSMRKYQLALVNSGERFELWESIAILGPLNDNDNNTAGKRFYKYFQKFMRQIRTFVFFVLPIVSQIVIINTMFMDLAFYHKDKFLKHDAFQNSPNKIQFAAGFDPIDVKELGYWFFFSKATAQEGADYTLSFSELNKSCGMYFYLEDLNSRINNLTKDEAADRDHLKEIQPTCAALGFPNFNLAINTWINLLMLAVTVLTSIYGSRMYAGKGLAFSRDIEINESKELPKNRGMDN